MNGTPSRVTHWVTFIRLFLVGTPRFEPRSYLSERRSDFGKAPFAPFKDGATLSALGRRRLLTAILQHQIAFRLRRHAISQGQTLKEFASEHPHPVRTLRLLRGEAAMQVEDIFWAEQVLGERQISVRFALGDRPASP